MTTYSGRTAALYITSDTLPVDFSASEATTADATRKRYTINAVAKRYWDEDTPITVKVDGVTVNTGYTLEYAGGVVVFDNAQGVGAVVTLVGGKYYTYAALAGAKEHNYQADVDTYETPMFGMDGYKTRNYGQTGFKVTMSRWWMDGNIASQYGAGSPHYGFLEGKKMIVVLFMNETNSTTHTGPRYEGFGYLSKDSIKVVSTGATEEDIDVEIDGQMYSRLT